MTLQDAHSDSPEHAFPEIPATPIDLAEMPTNPLMPSLLSADLAPSTPTRRTGSPGTFANSEMILTDTTSPVNPPAKQAQPGMWATAPTAFANSEMVVPQTGSSVNHLAGQSPFAPMPPPFPPA